MQHTHRLLDTDHPAPAEHLSVLPHRAQHVPRICVPDPEAVLDVEVQIHVGAATQELEVFDSELYLSTGYPKMMMYGSWMHCGMDGVRKRC